MRKMIENYVAILMTSLFELLCFDITFLAALAPVRNLRNMSSRYARTSLIASIPSQKINFNIKQRALSYLINENCPFLPCHTCFYIFVPVSLLQVMPSDGIGPSFAAALSLYVHFLYRLLSSDVGLVSQFVFI